MERTLGVGSVFAQALRDIGDHGFCARHHRMHKYREAEVGGALPFRASRRKDHQIEGRAVGNDRDFAEAGFGGGEVLEKTAAGPHLLRAFAGVEPCRERALMRG